MLRTLLALSVCLAASAQDARFGLELSLHGAGGRQVLRGQPALLEVRLLLEEGEQATVALNGGTPWAQAVGFRLWSGDGAEVATAWKPLGVPEGAMAFTAEAIEATAVFGLDEEATAALAPGTYLLTAVLDTRGRAVEGAWSGEASHRGLLFLVAAEPSELDEPARIAKARLRARWQMLNGNAEGALSELAAAPESIDTLADRADALAELDRQEEAIAELEKAISQFRQKNPKATHPPRLLLERLSRLKPY